MHKRQNCTENSSVFCEEHQSSKQQQNLKSSKVNVKIVTKPLPALLAFPGPPSPLFLRVFPKNRTKESNEEEAQGSIMLQGGGTYRFPRLWDDVRHLWSRTASGDEKRAIGMHNRGKNEDSLRFLGSQAAPSVPRHPEVRREHFPWVSSSLQLWVQEEVLQ